VMTGQDCVGLTADLGRIADRMAGAACHRPES
jgi:hypothetical protein